MKIGDYYLVSGLLYKIVDEEGDKFIVTDMTMVNDLGDTYDWKERIHKSVVEYACKSISKEEAEHKIYKYKIDALCYGIKFKEESIQNSKRKIKELKKELEKTVIK